MVRISNNPAKIIVLPTFVVILIASPLLLSFPEEQKSLALWICLGIWILLFAFAFLILPRHLIIHEKGITIRRRGRDEGYTFEELKGIKIKQVQSRDNPSRLVLKVKLDRLWYSFEIDYGRIRYVCKYLPKHLADQIDAV